MLTTLADFFFSLLQSCCQSVGHAATPSPRGSPGRRSSPVNTPSDMCGASVSNLTPVHLLEGANATRFLDIAQHR